MDQVFTATSAYSLGGVLALAGTAYVAGDALLPKNASRNDRYTFIWLAFDALIHFIFEGSFLWHSILGRTVNTGDGPLAAMWREYAAADFRWGVSDPTVVSIELLTVIGDGLLCVYILYLLIQQDKRRYFWIIVLSTAEIYGGWMTFCPEWLTGSPNLNTSNALHLWVYLFLMNFIWVIIPLFLMYDAYVNISAAFKASGKAKST